MNTTARGTPPPPPFLPPDERLRREFEWPLIKVQGTVIAAFILLWITVLFGLLRPRVSNPLMKTLATVIFFPVSNKLISFVPGLMEQNYKYDLFVLWLSFLTYLGAVANNYSCYRFGDNEDRRISLFMDYIFPWGTIAFSLCKDLIVPDVFVPVLVMFWMVLLKFRERRDGINYATRSNLGLLESTKVIYDFMSLEKKTDDVERGMETEDDGLTVNDGHMERHNFSFLVGVRDARSTLDENSWNENDDSGPTGLTPFRGLLGSDGPQSSLVTLDKIINQKEKLDKLLSPGQSEKLQATCFSFALFWMLLAKVAGHDVRTDTYSELIGDPNKASPNETNDEEVERIFNIIEMEIDFLYQYFYTNYYAIYAKGLKSKIWHLCIVALFLWLTLPLLSLYRPQDHSLIYVDISGRVVDNWITRFVIIVVLLVELAHIYLVLTSNWAKIIYLCHYVQNKSSGKLRELAIKYSTLLSFSFRGNKGVAQYSLQESYDSMPTKMWLAYPIKELRVMDVPEVGQTGIQYITLKPELKKPFIRFIKKSVNTNDRKISNGATALADNRANSLYNDYVKNLGNHSQVILVWHLATHRLQVPVSATDEHKQIATVLSQYCAYLVVFATKFLPDNCYISQCVFKKAKRDLNNDRDPREGNEFKLNSENRSITTMANRLKDELEINYNGSQWKILADFWTEMLLYLSLANNFEAIEAHADYLCTGGELITHLWALLNHAGCYRDPRVKPKIKTREDE